jgi:hypothetical protein
LGIVAVKHHSPRKTVAVKQQQIGPTPQCAIFSKGTEVALKDAVLEFEMDVAGPGD